MPRRFALAIGLLLASLGSVAQADLEEDLGGESGAPTEESLFESPRAIEVIGRRYFLDRGAGATHQTLLDAVGVSLLRTSGAAGSPFVRGLLGQQVLILVDGVRLNSSITPSGPNHLLGAIDLHQIDRIEVLRGPSSVIHGPEAMGGVINIITRKPHFDPRRAWDAAAALTGRFNSADTSFQGNLGLDGHLRGIGLHASGSLKRFDDLAGGSDTGTQRFTGYREGSADVSLAWAISPSSNLRTAYAAMRQHDIPRPDRSSPADFLLGAENLRDWGTLSYSGSWDHSFLRRVEATLSYGDQRELRERFRLEGDTVERERDRVSTLGLQLTLASELLRNSLSYGFDLYHDWIRSSAEREAISAALLSPQDRGRYRDGTRALQAGGFLRDRLALSDKLLLDAGVRLGAWDIHLPETASESTPRTRVGVTGNLHGRYLLGNGLNLVAGVSHGYRPPNVDDLSAQGCGERGFDLPGEDLKPEQSITTEAGVKLDLFSMITGSFFYFYTHLVDPMLRTPAILETPSGPQSTVSCGGRNTAGDPITMPVYHLTNAESGDLHGLESSLALTLSRWSFYVWLAWTRGDAGDGPLSTIPPLHGFAGLRYDQEGKRFVEIAVRWAGSQDRLSATDRRDLRICPSGPSCNGTSGFAVLMLRGGAQIARPFRFTLAVENLTHTSYRSHGSALDGAGISATLGLELIVQ